MFTIAGRPSAAADEEGLLDRVLLLRARLPHEELQGPAKVQEAPAAPIHSGEQLDYSSKMGSTIFF